MTVIFFNHVTYYWAHFTPFDYSLLYFLDPMNMLLELQVNSVLRQLAPGAGHWRQLHFINFLICF